MNLNSQGSSVPYAIHGTTSEDVLTMDRETVKVVVRPVETVVRFDPESSPVVYLARDIARATGSVRKGRFGDISLFAPVIFITVTSYILVKVGFFLSYTTSSPV